MKFLVVSDRFQSKFIYEIQNFVSIYMYIYIFIYELDIYIFIYLFIYLFIYELDVRGSVHHSTIHKENSNKIQQCIKILLFHIYLKLNMFRATHRPSSGA